MDSYAIGEKRLRSFGIEVSKLREDLRKVALHQAKKEAQDQEQDIMDISRLARRISRGEFRDNALEKQQLKPDFDQSVAISSRQRSKRRGPLSTSEKVAIVYSMLISFEKQAEVAREYRVSQQVIAHLMMKAKKNKQFLQELFDKRDGVANRRELIKGHVEELNGKREVIDSAAHVIKSLTKQHQIKTTELEVRDVMKLELGMRYRKIKIVSLHSNSEKNLVLRQRWAVEFLAQARKRRCSSTSMKLGWACRTFGG